MAGKSQAKSVPLNLLFLIVWNLFIPYAYSHEIRIGVLAKRGEKQCLEKWNATAEYLTQTTGIHEFTIVPLSFEEIDLNVRRQNIDFILTNPLIYAQLEYNYQVTRIATLKNRLNANQSSSCFGGVLFTLKSRKDLNTLSDMKHKILAAVDKTSFGGYIVTRRELIEHGYNPEKTFSKILFTGTHDKVVIAVIEGRADIGTVRTDTMERMHTEGKINIDDFKIFQLDPSPDISFPLKKSTRLYPEWPFSKLPHVSEKLAELVSTALINMPEDSPAAIQSKSTGWTIPSHYQGVHECMRELRISPYDQLYEEALHVFFIKNLTLLLVITFSVLSFLLIAVIFLFIRTSQLKQTRSELMTSKKEVELYLDIVQVMVVVLNTDKTIRMINKSGAHILEYSQKELVGKNWIDTVIPEKIRQEISQVFDEFIEHKNSSNKFYNNIVITKNKTTKLFAFRNSPILDSSGNVTAVLSSGVDITDKDKAEKQLLQSQKLDSVGKLTSAIAHDFNNILTGILGTCELTLLQNNLPDGIKRKIENIHECSEKATKLVKQLQGFSRQQAIKPEPVNFNHLIKCFAKTLLERVIHENIKLKILTAENLPCAMADTGQVEQIILNLVINARDAILDSKKHSTRQHIMIETDDFVIDESNSYLFPDCQQGRYILLKVSDTGTGMDNSIKNKIFDPFFSTKPKGKGTGLGLSTVYGIIKQNKGYIEVYSELGIGTTFKIYWPANCEDIQVSSKNDKNEVKIRRGTETILCIDDDENILNYITRILTVNGYKTMGATNGIDALRILEAEGEKIDLIISDIIMPEMGGKELANAIKHSGLNIQMLFMSGYPESYMNEEGFIDDNISFISKPFNMKQLSRSLSKMLD